MSAIDDCGALVCLLAPTTLTSPEVIAEITQAHRLGRPMIPVFETGFVKPTGDQPEAVWALMRYEGVSVAEGQDPGAAHAKLTRLIREALVRR